MTESKTIVGIDLGTTHCVLAYTRAPEGDDEKVFIETFAVPQVISPGDVKAQPLLPSFLFLPGPHDVPAGSLALPWESAMDFSVGEFARIRGAEIPARLVSSAKSWLSHTGVDRTAPILPWESPQDGKRVSPVDASARFLEHLRDGWNFERAQDDPSSRLESQEVYHGPGLLRRGGPRAHPEGGPAGRLSKRDADRGAPGRLLRLDRFPGGALA